MKGFKYYSNSTLKRYVGKEIQWIDPYEKIRTGILLRDPGKFSNRLCRVPEACLPNAETVLIKLPKR